MFNARWNELAWGRSRRVLIRILQTGSRQDTLMSGFDQVLLTMRFLLQTFLAEGVRAQPDILFHFFGFQSALVVISLVICLDRGSEGWSRRLGDSNFSLFSVLSELRLSLLTNSYLWYLDRKLGCLVVFFCLAHHLLHSIVLLLNLGLLVHGL